MFTTKAIYSGAALYATTTAFAAVWITLALPIRHNTVGPYNYHGLGKRIERFGEKTRMPWKRLARVL